jgi:SPP1 family predicted phage head-tail adaptor
MRAGLLRHRVQVQSPTGTQDEYGQAVLGWTTLGARWASVEPLMGREMWQAQQVQADTTHKVTLRYFDGLTPRYRLVEGKPGVRGGKRARHPANCTTPRSACARRWSDAV